MALNPRVELFLKPKYAAFCLFLLVAVIFGAYTAMLIIVAWPIDELSISKAGVFGDSFGVVNSLFSGLAFAGLIVTILLQREELAESIKIFKAQKFDDTFYRLLEFYKNNLNDINIVEHGSDKTHKGIGGLTYLLNKVNQSNKKYQRFINTAEGKDLYSYCMYRDMQKILMPQSRYLGTIENMLTLIQNNLESEIDRKFYINILASQLTVHEIKYLFYQCLVVRRGNNLTELINNSKLLEIRIQECNINGILLDFYNELHGVEFPHGTVKAELPYTRVEIRKFRKQQLEYE